MTKNNGDAFATELHTLAERLNRCEQVTRHDTTAERQAWVLAHDFLDLAESFRKFLDDQLPRLRDADLSCDEVHDVLIEIGEEFRHILYHVRDSEFYAYLRNDVSAPSSTSDDRR